MDDLIGKRLGRSLREGDFFLEEDLEGSKGVEFQNSFRTRWGLISRFSDLDEMIGYGPKVIEFHLAQKDFFLGFQPDRGYSQELVVHAPEYINGRLFDLCSGSEEVREASVRLLQKTIALSRELAPHFRGTPKVIAHPGAMSLNSKLNVKTLRAALIKSLEEVDFTGTEILLENLPPYPWYFGGQWKGNYFMDPECIRALCEETGLGICFDLSHAALYCNAKEKDLPSFIAEVLPFVHHVHFADAYGLDGEGMPIGEGDIDFDGVMPLFSDYQGTWVPEIWRGHLNRGRGFLQALTRLRQYDI
jgi:N-acetylneuraminate synthase